MLSRFLPFAFIGLVVFNPLGAQSPDTDKEGEVLRITLNRENFEIVLQSSNLDFSDRNSAQFFLGGKEISEAEYLKAAGEAEMAEEALAHQRRLSGIFWTGIGACGLGTVLSISGGNGPDGNPSAVTGFGFTLVLGSLVPLFWGQYNKTRFDLYQLWKIGQKANASKREQNQTVNSDNSTI